MITRHEDVITRVESTLINREVIINAIGLTRHDAGLLMQKIWDEQNKNLRKVCVIGEIEGKEYELDAIYDIDLFNADYE